MNVKIVWEIIVLYLVFSCNWQDVNVRNFWNESAMGTGRVATVTTCAFCTIVLNAQKFSILVL